MDKLRIEIELGNAAFDDDPDGEVMRILSRIIDGLRANTPIATGTLCHANSIFDANGARVGQIKVHVDHDQQG